MDYTSILDSQRFYINVDSLLQIARGEEPTLLKNEDLTEMFLSNKVNALMLAVIRGNLEYVKFAIDNGVLVNMMSEHGNTALMMAACRGKLEIIKYLLEHGANVDLTDNNGLNALMYSCMGSPIDTINLFNDIGAINNDIILNNLNMAINSDLKEKNTEEKLLDRYEIIKTLINAKTNPNTCVKTEYSFPNSMRAIDFYVANLYMSDLSIIDMMLDNNITPSIKPEELYKMVKKYLFNGNNALYLFNKSKLKNVETKVHYLVRKLH